jgi:predicted O-methyltransferase YrrM
MNATIDKVLKALKNPEKVAVLLRSRIAPKDGEGTRMCSWVYGSLPRLKVTEVFPRIRDVNVEIHRAFDRKIETSIDAYEIFVLCAVIKSLGAKRILEIGTFDGNTALNLAANSPPDAAVTTIDLPPDWDGEMGMSVPEACVNVTKRHKVGIQFQNTPFARKITQVFGDSAKLDWSRLPAPFDVVFIDGCHYYEYVKKDTQNALRYLKADGVVIWHDYGMIRDVSHAVDETAARIEVKAIRGTRLAVGFKQRSGGDVAAA